MSPASLVVVADRGSVKAYRVNDTPTRGPSLQLLRAFDLTAAHGRMQDKLTDQAGRFSAGMGGNGTHSGTAERSGIDIETDRRIHKQLADQIADVWKKETPGAGWSLAAPASIHSAIVDLLPHEVRDRIVEHVRADLVKIDASDLAPRFRSLQPA
ncbi:MAG: host attachment protein [Verrucomicrobiota bacterium]|nr:host attachment protein [Verrucomicrobiota bacterium]